VASRDRRTADRHRLLSLIDRFPSRRIGVVGDVVADEFIYGRVARVSREAPVLILEYDRTDVVPGGAGNAAQNVAALGARTRAVGVVGADTTGDRLLQALNPLVDRRALWRPKGSVTPTKTRILAGGIHSAKQQVVRIDRSTRRRASAEEVARTTQAALGIVSSVDAMLISDYGAGLVSPRLASAVARAARERRRGAIPVVIDSRYDLGRYRGLTASTPNESEVEAMVGERLDDDPRRLERAGRRILEQTRMRMVLITRGSRGMALFEPGTPTEHLPIYGSDEIADVTGAGDTVIATMTLALAAGASGVDAARLANYAGGLVVMKRGTATVSARELTDAVNDDLGR
jgi:rfaE bifunctional protein kinase chain/domain